MHRRSIGLVALLAGCPAKTPSSAEPDASPPREASERAALPTKAPPRDEKREEPPRESSDRGVITQLEDGSYTFAGIRLKIAEARANAKALELREVLVNAWVQSVHPAPPCPVDPGCPAGAVPHAWVTETNDPGASPMKLVDWSFAIPKRDAKLWKGVPAITLEAGQRYTFRVEMRPAGDDARTTDDAVLLFRGYRPLDADEGWTYPPGAPWHPVALMDAEMRRAAERPKH